MKGEIGYTCDNCGHTKGEGNKWSMAFLSVSAIVFSPWDANLTGGILLHLCGPRCATTVLDRFLTTGKAAR